MAKINNSIGPLITDSQSSINNSKKSHHKRYAYVHLQECSDYLAPHRLMKKAAGRPVVMVPLILYSDDTSGNKSKKWHLFKSWSVLLAGLPRETNSQLTNIHFLSWSDKVSVLEMAEPITNELVHLEREGTEVYDAHLQCNVLVMAPVLCAICDNPRASEMVNHMKGASIKFCRICNVRNQHLNTHSLLYYDLSITI